MMSALRLVATRYGWLMVYCALSLALLIAAASPGLADGNDSAPAKRVLRIGADPNNLPFTNQRLEGFENKIAELLAKDLGAEIEYVWKPQRRSFFRQLLSGGQADLVIGVPHELAEARTTQPYYRSRYVFVYREDSPLSFTSFGDPSLLDSRIGVHLAGRNGTPPALELAARGLISNVHSYAVYGDTKEESPVGKIIEAVADKQLDVAIVWGPVGGYFAKRQSVPLKVIPVPENDTKAGLRFSFDISIGVSKDNNALCQELDEFLVRRRELVDSILQRFGVPLASATEEKRE